MVIDISNSTDILYYNVIQTQGLTTNDFTLIVFLRFTKDYLSR